MSFVPDLFIGQVISNDQLMKIFRCGRQGGMRRSLKTNTLVLITDYTDDTYLDAKPDKDDNYVWKYCGMGDNGDQNIDYKHNKTLYESNKNNEDLHLFKKEAPNSYEYIGKVLLIGEPKRIKDPNKNRKLLIFPLEPVGNTQDITDFLNNIGFKILLKEEIIDGSTNYLAAKKYDAILKLMVANKVDTLIGSDGWFFNSKGYFYNQYSKDGWGKIQDIEDKKNLFIGQNKYINPYFSASLVYSEQDNSNNMEDENKMGKFRLRTLNFKSYNVNYKIDFYNKDQELSGKGKFYTTLILGPNGTGKSIVLSTIQKIFLDMYLLSISRKENHAKDIEYELIYTIGENKFKLLKENGKPTFYKNDLKVSLKEIVLPKRVISCAFNIEDRFSTTSAKVLEEYQYLGLKNKKFKYLLENLTSNIIDAVLTDNKFLNDLKNVTEFLGFGPELKIRLPFKGNNSLEDMRNNNYVTKLLTNANEKSIVAADIIAFWKKYRTYNLVDPNNKTINYIENGLEIFFDFSRSADYEEMYEDFDEIKKQIKLGVFRIPDIEMKKNGKWFSIEGSSSGEFQYMSTMINILTKIKSKSLILIDEPETSLHPNWQYKYMSVLDKIFKEYNECQFVMATHSHFMVSDLKNESSSLIELKSKSNELVISKNINESVYGRSAEDILYEVFNMPTSRNYYIGKDLDEVLQAISLDRVNDDIRDKAHKLFSMINYLKESDPLKELIMVIYKKVTDIV